MKLIAESKSKRPKKKNGGPELQIDTDDNIPMVDKKLPKCLSLSEAIVNNENSKDSGPKRAKK